MSVAESRDRSSLAEFDGQAFDVLVIGGGIIGASTSQHLAARGFRVLLVDKADFASGTTSRSSRLLYSGLAYFSPDHAIWRYMLKPRDLLQRLRLARLAMRCRTELVRTMPGRLGKHRFAFPIRKNDRFPAWKVDLGYRMLGLFGSSDVSLNYERVSPVEAVRQNGLVGMMEQDELQSVALFDEYQYLWAERICVDTALDAEDCGAVLRNYTEVVSMSRHGSRWRVVLSDRAGQDEEAVIECSRVVNSAGPWVDRLLRNSLPGARKHIVGIKGVNLLVRLPDQCRGAGLETISRSGQPFYCMPWGDHHFVGPTETVFEGDPDQVKVTTEDMNYVLGEANAVFPRLSLGDKDVVHAWAGVRPRTYAGRKTGMKALTITDMAEEGAPGMVTVAGPTIMMHRHAGRSIARYVARDTRPSEAQRQLSYAARWATSGSLADTAREKPHALLDKEHAVTLADVMFRRLPHGWEPDLGLGRVEEVADAAAGMLGWSTERRAEEIASYKGFVRQHFAPPQGNAGEAP